MMQVPLAPANAAVEFGSRGIQFIPHPAIILPIPASQLTFCFDKGTGDNVAIVHRSEGELGILPHSGAKE